MKIIKNLIKLIKNKKRILLAYSGGIDSTVLFYKLMDLKKIKKIKIRAIHINHQLHKNSIKWANHCFNNCKENSIPITIVKVIPNIKKFGIEGGARKARYDAIKNNILKNEILMTAQHQDDQCETFFLALKRSSGPKGLSCMPKKKKFFNNLLIRPFLEISKKKIYQIAKKNNLKWIEDNTNNNIKYERNFIRKKILVPLKKRWPFFIKNCCISAKLCSDQEKVIKDLLKFFFNKYLCKKNMLNINFLRKMNSKTINIILRTWIYLNSNNFFSIRKIEILKNTLIKNNNNFENKKIIFKKYEIRRYKEYIYWLNTIPSLKNIILSWFYPYNKIILPYNLGYLTKHNTYIKNSIKVKKPEFNELINIRFYYNKKIKLKKDKIKRKIKTVWQKYDIPPWERQKTPLLFYNCSFIGAINIFTTNKNKYDSKKYFYIKWFKNY
ncbi:tRNA lysidine(34) synthetase TilS [Buchnera aphidicola (Taiwanaphis decaspermi)]|uniref:tRNA lysidine(34) synthetase TilS n=1 Tax=Buchnera aphidicola TaxID=9 RepID=UPI0031B856D8